MEKVERKWKKMERKWKKMNEMERKWNNFLDNVKNAESVNVF